MTLSLEGVGLKRDENESNDLEISVSLKKDSRRLGHAAEVEYMVFKQSPREDVTITT